MTERAQIANLNCMAWLRTYSATRSNQRADSSEMPDSIKKVMVQMYKQIFIFMVDSKYFQTSVLFDVYGSTLITKSISVNGHL